MTSRQSVVVKAARLVQRLPLSWLRVLEAPLVRIRGRNCSNPQLVIILALPRSGSTLIYQCFIHGLQPLYLSNLWNLWYSLPCLGGSLSARMCATYQSEFQSSQGFVQGICGPAEGLRFWSYWCGCGLDEVRDVHVQDVVLTRRVRYLRRTLSLLTTPEKPFVCGYIGHALAVERLRLWFPEAIFVRLHRDPLSNAASILRSRQKGSCGWFSVFPKECEGVKGANEYTQAAAQVYWLNRRLKVLENDEQTIHISYEDLCIKPRRVFQRVVDLCNEKGMRLKLRQELPESFDYKEVHGDENEDVASLGQALKKLEKKHGPL